PAAAPAPAAAPVPRKLELLVLLPEPRVLGTEYSVNPEGARHTVFSPAREVAEVPGIQTYSKEEFQKLGISPETFTERAKATADRLLADIQPDLVKDAEGRVLYAVYRSERPLMASLVTAPSLAATFEKLFGLEIWVALPDRHSLFVFPADPDALEEYTMDLNERWRADTHSASPEIFTLKKGEAPKVVGSFGS
ncbi:MAG TPA: hypothetical protein PK490_07180, partial [Prosthecobacter sp.]|nr:hypothetical protein [Prosthecobacter sp.]HRK14055.1 hypothetical protein [Prosthecobacter sp.]